MKFISIRQRYFGLLDDMYGQCALWCCIFFACSSSCCAAQSLDQKDDELCKVITETFDNNYACKPIDQCPTVLKDSNYPKICRFHGRTPVVCCPIFENYPSPAKATEQCKEYYSLTKKGGGTIESGYCRTETVEKGYDKNRLTIVGGIAAEESEFPHMVLLGFGDHIKNVKWSCGGSLISDRFVLSAAHCSEIGKKGPVKWALLGDNDLATDGGNADPQIREIVRRTLHPGYKPPSMYNDIGLYQLNTPVLFSRFVLPICLNTETSLVSKRAIAIGWGRTGSAGPTSNILMKVSLDLVEQNECNSSYSSFTGKNLASGISPDTHICAGQMEGGKDTCQGDSGGPLQIVHPEFKCMYAQVGVTSFGKICGEPIAPGVYTRVSSYVPWIESIVWPTSATMTESRPLKAEIII